jgi:hypothetical protein
MLARGKAGGEYRKTLAYRRRFSLSWPVTHSKLFGVGSDIGIDQKKKALP